MAQVRFDARVSCSTEYPQRTVGYIINMVCKDGVKFSFGTII